MDALPTQSDPRPRALDELRDAFLRSAAPDSAGSLEALLAERPGLVAAHLLRIGKAVVAKDVRAFASLESALAAAEPHRGHASEHELMHIAAAEAWLAHKPLLAAHLYSNIVAKDPFDLLALRLAQSCWFFLGRRAKLHAVAERALAAWSPLQPGHDIVLAMTAFGCDEAGDAVRAEALARRALEIEPRNPYAIHALAHALGAQGRQDAVVKLLKARAPEWRVGGRLDSHIAWHLAAAQVEIGNLAAARMALDVELVPVASRGASAAGDATDLAWRLELAGANVGTAWERLANAWSRHHAPGFWAPDDLLAGIAYLRAGWSERASALQHGLAAGPHPRRCAERAARMLTLPALAALDAFVRGGFAAAESHLRATIERMGGSLLQRELFELTLRAASRLRAPFATPPEASRIPA